MTLERFVALLLLLVPVYDALKWTMFYLISVANWKRISRSYLRFIQLAAAANIWLTVWLVPQSTQSLYMQVLCTALMGRTIIDLLNKEGWGNLISLTRSKTRRFPSPPDSTLTKRATTSFWRKVRLITTIAALIYLRSSLG